MRKNDVPSARKKSRKINGKTCALNPNFRSERFSLRSHVLTLPAPYLRSTVWSCGSPPQQRPSFPTAFSYPRKLTGVHLEEPETEPSAFLASPRNKTVFIARISTSGFYKNFKLAESSGSRKRQKKK